MFLHILGLLGTKIAVVRELPLENVEDEVINQYPRVSLGRSGFVFARADKGRRLENFSGSSVAELEQFVGKGKLFIIPRRDLPLPSPVHHQEVHPAAEFLYSYKKMEELFNLMMYR